MPVPCDTTDVPAAPVSAMSYDDTRGRSDSVTWSEIDHLERMRGSMDPDRASITSEEEMGLVWNHYHNASI